jgi:hypothetical protein
VGAKKEQAAVKGTTEVILWWKKGIGSYEGLGEDLRGANAPSYGRG